MTSFTELTTEADHKWQELVHGQKAWIRIGMAMCGEASGAREVAELLRSQLDARKLDAVVDEVGCFGLCYLEPLVDVKKPGGPRVFFGNVAPEDIDSLIDDYVANVQMPEKPPLGYLGEDGTEGLADLQDLRSLSGVKMQHRVALRNAGNIAPDDVYQYLANGGYSVRLSGLALSGPLWLQSTDTPTR